MIEVKNKLCIAIIIGLMSIPAVAADKRANAEPAHKRAAGRDSSSVAHLADQLAQYGDKNKDVLALITAAKMHIQAGTQEKALDKEAATGKPSKTEPGQPRPDMSPRGLLERAKLYAVSRQDLIALADDIAATIDRGRVEGPTHFVTSVEPRATDSIPVTFEAHESASVAITGNGATDLDLGVFDEKGNQVCGSSSTGDVESCSITPRWTGRFFVRVKNLGGQVNHYQIVLN